MKKQKSQMVLWPTTENLVLDFMKIKVNKLKVYKWVWKLIGDEAIMTRITDSTVEKAAISIYSGDPGKASDLIQWYNAILRAGYTGPITLRKVEEIYKKYEPRWLKYYSKKVRKERGIIPFMNKTKAVQEFIARGFKHEDDVTVDRLKRYCVKCNIAPLWWPEDFDSHQDAIAIQSKFGIHGYTGTTLPKR